MISTYWAPQPSQIDSFMLAGSKHNTVKCEIPEQKRHESHKLNMPCAVPNFLLWQYMVPAPEYKKRRILHNVAVSLPLIGATRQAEV
jgi:hypothetical protein